jgi:hypothetical protein
VPPPRRSAKHIQLSRNEAMKGPLAYFSCQPVPVKKMPICPKYDLDDVENYGDPNMEERQPRGKRTVSAPATPHGGSGRGGARGKGRSRKLVEDYDDFEEEEDYDPPAPRSQRRSSAVRERPRPAPRSQPQQRAQSSYWTGPSKTYDGPRAGGSSRAGGGSSGGSVVSRRWANATSALEL